MAAMRNEPECLEFLLLNGKETQEAHVIHTPLHDPFYSSEANIKARTLRDMDAAYMASIVGSVPCLKILLRHGIDINAKYGAGYTMMHSAVINGRVSFVEALIECKADMERKTYDKKLTPLHLSARQGQVRTKYLTADREPEHTIYSGQYVTCLTGF